MTCELHAWLTTFHLKCANSVPACSTDFVQSHPGGPQRIMLAAGGSVDSFWGDVCPAQDAAGSAVAGGLQNRRPGASLVCTLLYWERQIADPVHLAWLCTPQTQSEKPPGKTFRHALRALLCMGRMQSMPAVS